jgi:hypothetical protein
VVGDRKIRVLAPYSLDKVSLLVAVAYSLRCRTVRQKVWVDGGHAYDVHLFGFESDLERVELLFTSLLVQASYGLAGARPAWSYESVSAYRRSWLAGFTQAIRMRLHQAEERAKHEAQDSVPGVALVLVKRSDLVDRAVDHAYPKLRPSPRRRLSGSGHGDGQSAGRRADLGGTRIAKSGGRQAVSA